jgi:hypothetical protein
LELILGSKLSTAIKEISNFKFGTLLVKKDLEPSPIHTTKVTLSFNKGAHAVILVYDITNLETFQSI